jgi:hypothetical protein
MLSDNTVYDRKAKAFPLPIFFGCEERFENFSFNFGTHAYTIVTNSDDGILSDFASPCCRMKNIIDKGGACRNDERSTVSRASRAFRYEIDYNLPLPDLRRP